MAPRQTSRVSRRQAVVALGAGLVGGTVGAGSEEQTRGSVATSRPATVNGVKCGPMPAPKPNPVNCTGHQTVARYRARKANGKGYQLQLDTCCEYLGQELLYGYCSAHVDTQTKLKQFMSLLQEVAEGDGLLDYCFLQFDLKEDELKLVKESVERALTPAPKAAKD